MPSPFPGMDPYIEAYGDWADFRACIATYTCDFLNERLPEVRHLLAYDKPAPARLEEADRSWAGDVAAGARR